MIQLQEARIPNYQNPAELCAWIRTKGCFTEEQNLKIYQLWFRKPRRSFLAALRYFNLSTKIVCDVGCGYGSNLLYCSPQSYGLEVNQAAVDFARAIGVTAYQRDVLTDVSDVPKADAVWCADVLEHVESPHIFMRKLYQLLQPEGLVMIKVPTIPLWRFPIPVIKRYQTGYQADDHINGLTGTTLRFLGERSGFQTILVGVFLAPAWRWLNQRRLLTENIGQVVYIGRKIEGWQYPPKAFRIATETGQGFHYKPKFEQGKWAKRQQSEP